MRCGRERWVVVGKLWWQWQCAVELYANRHFGMQVVRHTHPNRYALSVSERQCRRRTLWVRCTGPCAAGRGYLAVDPSIPSHWGVAMTSLLLSAFHVASPKLCFTVQPVPDVHHSTSAWSLSSADACACERTCRG